VVCPVGKRGKGESRRQNHLMKDSSPLISSDSIKEIGGGDRRGAAGKKGPRGVSRRDHINRNQDQNGKLQKKQKEGWSQLLQGKASGGSIVL